MFRKRLVSAIAIAAVVCVATSQARAAFKLRFSDGSVPDVTIIDNGAGDTNAAAGLVVASVSMADFNVVVAVSTSKPVNGLSPTLSVNLSSVAYTHTGTAPILTVTATDTDFGPPVFSDIDLLTNSATQNVGTTTTSVSSTAEAFLDTTNVEFGTTVPPAIAAPLISFAAIGDSQNGDSAASTLAGTTPYSLTSIFTITATGDFTGGQFSHNLSIQPIPEPSSFLLLGLAVPAFGAGVLIRRRRAKKTAKK